MGRYANLLLNRPPSGSVGPTMLEQMGENTRLPTIAISGRKNEIRTVPTNFFNPLPETLTPQDRTLLEYHRDQLQYGTYLDDDMGMTTVNITGVEGPDGRVYNVPGYADGVRLNEDQARNRAAATGWDQYPSFPREWAGSPEMHPANVAARKLHDLIDTDGRMFRDFMRSGQTSPFAFGK